MKLSLRRAVTALALTATGLAVAAAPAAAAPTDCPTAYACLWTVSGQRWQSAQNNPTLPPWIDNQARAAFNNGVRCPVHWHTGSHYTGARLTMAPGSGGYLGPMADGISSMRWC